LARARSAWAPAPGTRRTPAGQGARTRRRPRAARPAPRRGRDGASPSRITPRDDRLERDRVIPRRTSAHGRAAAPHRPADLPGRGLSALKRS
jgi:hypothetical protein